MLRWPLLALMLLASPALGADVWLAPTADTDSTGVDSTHAHSLGWANANATDGTQFRFKSGTYNGTIAPTSSPATRVSFTGFTHDTSAVRINGISLGSQQDALATIGNKITVRWMSCGSLTGCVRTTSDSLIRIAAQTTNTKLSGTSCVMDSCKLTGTITGSSQYTILGFVGDRNPCTIISDPPPDHCDPSQRGSWKYGSIANKFQNGTITGTADLTGDVHFIHFSAATENVLLNNTINITETSCGGYFYPLEMYEGYNSDIRGNTWNIVMNGAGSRGGVWAMRDSSNFNRFVSNTVNISGSGLGIGILWTNGGSWSDGRGRNYMGYNTIKDACSGAFSSSSQAALDFGDGGNVDTVEFNTISTRYHLVVKLQNIPDSLVFRYNTLYTQSISCFTIDHGNPTNATIHGNIFVCRPSNRLTYNATNDGYCINTMSGTAFGLDSNYYAPSVLWKMGSNSDWPYYRLDSTDWPAQSWAGTWRSLFGGCSPYVAGRDCRSVASAFSGDLFKDARWNSLDLRPGKSSPLRTGGPNDGTWGALQPVP